MDWGDYDHYHPVALGLPAGMPRATAVAEFENLMTARPQRRRALGALLARNGVHLGDDDASISTIDRWLVENIRPYSENPSRPDPWWYAAILDLSLFLGDVIIERNEGLHWDIALWGGKRNPSFQRAVIAGFPPDGMNISFDTDLRLAAYGVALVSRLEVVPDQMTAWLRQAHSMSTRRYGPR